MYKRSGSVSVQRIFSIIDLIVALILKLRVILYNSDASILRVTLLHLIKD